DADENLQRFRTGDSKVLVTTNVAEEGLDIQECGLVVKYNYVTNEIALIQRKGRGRAVGSKSVLLAKENFILNKEVLNILRSKLMDAALDVISEKGQDWILDRVQRLFVLHCKKCDQLFMKSRDVRVASMCHFVCVDPTIWERLAISTRTEPKICQTVAISGKICCRKCKHECGSIVKYSEVFYPAFKIDGVCLVDEATGKRLVERKWKAVQEKHFVPGPVESKDSMAMYSALASNFVDEMNQRIMTLDHCA
ncbi:unnamed protein product, partial [Soboliphyme baturini]|uniref:Helicase C-terminal domain-containing protein n=1 Tax=Soboliphyme baturini TaxID=241478 RepID=A0A183J9G2_9BILA